MSDIEHKWGWCVLCGLMVKCGHCGMNTCSGVTGPADDMGTCPHCKDAYAMYMDQSVEAYKERVAFLEKKCMELDRELNGDPFEKYFGKDEDNS